MYLQLSASVEEIPGTYQHRKMVKLLEELFASSEEAHLGPDRYHHSVER